MKLKNDIVNLIVRVEHHLCPQYCGVVDRRRVIAFLLLTISELIIKLIVESSVETVYERHLLLVTLLVWLQQYGTERRRQSQRVDSRNNDRYRHGYTELTVEVTGSTTDE